MTGPKGVLDKCPDQVFNAIAFHPARNVPVVPDVLCFGHKQ
jgi:hypothetical protein